MQTMVPDGGSTACVKTPRMPHGVPLGLGNIITAPVSRTDGALGSYTPPLCIYAPGWRRGPDGCGHGGGDGEYTAGYGAHA